MFKCKKDFFKHNIKYILGIVFAITGILYDIYLNIEYKWFLDSDMAAEMMLAKKLNMEGGILSKSWYYSTELRVFCQQWFLRLGLLFYPDNWHRARMIGGILMILVTVLSFYFFLKIIGCGREYAAFGAGVLAWPFGREYFFYAIWGLYYLSHIILAVIIVSLMLMCFKDFDQNRTNRFNAKVIIALLFSFLCGLNGIRLIYATFFPLVLTCLIITFLDNKNNAIKKTLLSTSMLLVSTMGWIYNIVILSQKYSFNSFGDITLKNDFSFTIEDLLRDYFRYFGYQGGVKIFSFIGIASCLGILFAVLVFFSSIRLLFIYKKLDSIQKFIVVYYHSSLLVHLMMFYFVDYYCAQYFLTLLPFAISIVIIELKNENWNYKLTNKAIVVLISVTICICSNATVLGEQISPKYALHSYYSQKQAVDWLLENGYYQGFGSFWQTNVLTELSNGQIEMWNIGWRLCGKTDLEVLEWLQSTDHAERLPEGKTFIFYNKDDDLGFELSPLLNNGEMVFENGYYYIFVYDSVEDMLEGIEEGSEEDL
ncbi:hypothetical protein [Butyrivibrio sp. TB]|uniref:hypothetical protein n=1 Tax=Butyrivibrio sp. TB TaxID=1520809 RepID=UPI0008D58D33|nr:hypothetical protein [Butyrivibrio sp. TB]SEQ36514.1 hypothetical protein SAMN02910382_02780 [Butyrivibrio sp. TB]